MKKIVYLALFLTNISYASPSTDLASKLNSVHTMQSSFSQTIYDNRGKAVQNSGGEMALDRPGKFRWQVKAPIPQLLIANESKLWIYDPDLEQVIIRSLSKGVGGTPALLLSHVNEVLDKSYVVTTLPPKDGLTWYHLKPRAENNMFSSIAIGFSGNNISKMRMEDNLGHITLITFNHPKFNSTLAPALFIFKAPRNVDVIDETKKAG